MSVGPGRDGLWGGLWNWTRTLLLLIFLVCTICNLARLLIRLG